MRLATPPSLPWLLATWCCGVAGCLAPPRAPDPSAYLQFQSPSCASPCAACSSAAESSYAQAATDERAGSACCVDRYYDAAILAWRALETSQGDSCDPCWAQAWDTYHAALSRLVETARQYRRIDPRCSLLVRSAPGGGAVPIAHVGSPWQPGDFQTMEIARREMSARLENRQYRCGIGVPVVVGRLKAEPGTWSRFVRDRSAFAATAVLRTDSQDSAGFSGGAPVLELLDPIRVSHTTVGGKSIALAADLSAPLGVVARHAVDTGWTGFLDPANVSPESLGLIFLEPYQPGKIPVVFVHGLISDPTTWLDLVNDLRARPEIAQNYQFWAFRYATGQAFLKSAAELRRDLDEAIRTCDPAGQDPALSQMVLIGHSMGGLVSKLQVTHSGMALWSVLSPCSPQTIRMDEATRRQVYERFFFEPQPFVSRVIFIGTPHGGSSFASRFAGRIGSMLVNEPEEDSRRLRQLQRDNEGSLTALARRLPTSVDMLQPDMPALEAIQTLPVSRQVRLHSIIGTGRPMLLSGPADGVVPVESARHPCVDSELFVNTTHTKLHRHPETVREVTRILVEHAGCQRSN
jgi:pimeloyl-ACP methyl ester carboxylesterase